MAHGYLKKCLKIVSVIFGGITVLITSNAFMKMDRSGGEIMYLAVVSTFFGISLIALPICTTVKAVTKNIYAKMADMIFHLLGGILLIITGIVWFIEIDGYVMIVTQNGTDVLVKVYGVVEHVRINGTDVERISHSVMNEQVQIQRAFSGVFGFLNGFIYFVLGFLLLKKSNLRELARAISPAEESDSRVQ